MAGQDVAEDIWAGLISDSGTIGGVETMFNEAQDSLRASSPAVVNSTDIARAAGNGVSIAANTANTEARVALGGDINTPNLKTVLDDFSKLYTRTRIYTFHQTRTSFGGGNAAPVTPDFTKKGYQSSLGGSAGTFVPASLLEGSVDRTDYESVITQLRGHITSESGVGGGTLNYCHSSCHNACHAARGRR